MNDSEHLSRFLEVWSAISADTIDTLDQIYDENIAFSDPLHHVQGLPSLRQYIANMYENVTEVRFSFGKTLVDDDQACVEWVLRYAHPRLRGGEPIDIPGCSRLEFTVAGKVIRHRDYFDAGAFLYEHLPIVGSIIRALKRRLSDD